ncbi:MAG: desulfoferrodoxin [Dehalococcoidia bacterium]|nr:desulfoferrodoxin [Dehalococcoidia bacterium]
MANTLGKRYLCETCKTEVLCTKQGAGVVACCGKDMVEQQPRPLPSSD